MFQLAFDPLQGVVDGFDVPVKLAGHLVVRLAVEIGRQDLPFQIAELALGSLLIYIPKVASTAKENMPTT